MVKFYFLLIFSTFGYCFKAFSHWPLNTGVSQNHIRLYFLLIPHTFIFFFPNRSHSFQWPQLPSPFGWLYNLLLLFISIYKTKDRYLMTMEHFYLDFSWSLNSQCPKLSNKHKPRMTVIKWLRLWRTSWIISEKSWNEYKNQVKITEI